MTPLRASLARSPPRLGRSQAGGLHPQTPRAAPPGAPSRTGPLLPRSPSRRGSGHGCDGGGGGQPLAVVHARRLAPGGFRASGEIQRVGRADARRGKSGACPRCKGGGGQPGPGGGRPGCSRRLCPPSTDWARLSTGDRVQGGAVVQNNLIGQTFLVLHNQPAQSRASIGFQENHCIKK